MKQFDISELGRRIAQGSMLMLTHRVLSRSTGLIKTIILARLLLPDDIGLLALAMAVYFTLSSLTTLKFDLAIIYEPNASADDFNTAWTLSVLRAVVATIIVALAAGPPAAFFREPRLEEMLFVLSLLVLVEGFDNIGIVKFRKELEYRRLFLFQIYVQLISVSVTILLVIYLASYWAVVFGLCSERIASLVLSYVMHPFRPRLSLSRWRQLMAFSKWTMLTSVMTHLSDRIDLLILGRFFAAPVLGVYSLAHQLSVAVATDVVLPVAGPLFPGFTKLADDRERLSAAYFDAFGILNWLGWPLVIGTGLTAELIVGVLFGEKWSGVAPLVGVLAIFGLIRTAAAGGFSLLLAMGRPKFLSCLALVRLVVLVPTAYWGAHVAGPYGVAWAVVASSGLRLFLLLIIQARLLNVGLAAYANALWRCVVSSMAMAFGLIVMIWKLPNAETFFDKASHLTLLVVLGGFIYLTTSFTLWILSGRPNQAEGRIFSLIWGTIGQKLKSTV